MITPDFSNRTYIAEVLRTPSNSKGVLDVFTKLTHNPTVEQEKDATFGLNISITHSFLATTREFHRSRRNIVLDNGKQIEIPRRVTIRSKELLFYDVLFAQCGNFTIIAVPFHDLAEEFFTKLDRAMSGSQVVYQKLDITKLVLRLGTSGTTKLKRSLPGDIFSLTVTRCHLVYSDAETRVANLKKVQMSGEDLGKSPEYQTLLAPVLKAVKDPINSVTPVVLGFSLSLNGVKKAGATTDKHGNFKLWVAAGTRQLIRMFGILQAMEALDGVAFTTSNVPILQSDAIREVES